MALRLDIAAIALGCFSLGVGAGWGLCDSKAHSREGAALHGSERDVDALQRRLKPFKEQVNRVRQREDSHDVGASTSTQAVHEAEMPKNGSGDPFLMRLPDGGLKIDFEAGLDAGILNEKLTDLQQHAPALYDRLIDEINTHIEGNAFAVSNRLAMLSAFPDDLFKGEDSANHEALLHAVSMVGESHRVLNGFHEYQLSPNERRALSEESASLSHEIRERLEIERSSLFRTLMGELGYCDSDANELVSVLNAVVEATSPCLEADEATLLSNVVLSPTELESEGTFTTVMPTEAPVENSGSNIQ